MRALIRFIAAVSLLGTLTAGVVPAADADEVLCSVYASSPLSGAVKCVLTGSRTEPGGAEVQATGGGTPGCFYQGREVPCAVDLARGFGLYSVARWSNGFGCWVTDGTARPDRVEFLLGLAVPVSGEQTPEAALYMCYYPPLTPSGSPSSPALVWAESAPPPTVMVDPADLAVAAVGRMDLRAVEQQIAPPPLSHDPASMALVGLPVWLWTDPTAATWGPQSTSASAAGLAVTATMEVTGVEWEMGDGTVLNCGPGTPYDRSYGLASSPTCGHVYRQAGFPYTITASATWEGSWSGGGRSGDLSLTLTSTEQLATGEAQAVRTSTGSR